MHIVLYRAGTRAVRRHLSACLIASLLVGAGCQRSKGGAGDSGGAGGDSGGAGGTGDVCVPGTTFLCYSGPLPTLGVGQCAGGTATCNASGTGFGPCAGEILPEPETCLTAEDDDCDAQTNEEGAGCACAPSSTAPCYTGPAGTQNVGACHDGTQSCSSDGTAYGPCMNEGVPSAESCFTASDDDCDGQTNEEGAGCECVPGTVSSCYTGPSGTAGVGVCASGTQTCLSSGTAWGPCAGQVTPVVEDCGTSVDDDCDGSAECDVALIFTKKLGGASEETALDVVADGAGNLYVTGWFTGTVDFGAGPLVSAGDKDVFLIKLDPSGTVLWSKRFGTSMLETGVAITSDTDGHIILIGDFQYEAFSTTSVNFGLGPVLSHMPTDWGTAVFVVELDGAGDAIWNQAIAPDHYEYYASDVVLNAAGDPHVLWGFHTGVNYSGGMAKFDGANGTNLWLRGGFWTISRAGIAVDSASNVLIASGWVGPTCCYPGAVRLRKYDLGGNILWDREFSGPSFASGGLADIGAVDATDHLVAAGKNWGDLDFGGGVLPAPGMFLVKMDPAGNHVWSKNIAATTVASIEPRSIAMDGSSQFVVTGAQSQAVDYGGGLVSGSSFLAKFAPSGAHLWSKGLSTMSVSRVAVDGAGRTLVIGTFSGTIDLGSGPIPSSGGTDSILAVFGP